MSFHQPFEMYAFEHNEDLWFYSFLVGDGRLSELDKYTIMKQAAALHEEGDTKRRFEGDEFECTLLTDRKYALLGTFGGYWVRAIIEHNMHGKIDVEFLLRTPATSDPISIN